MKKIFVVLFMVLGLMSLVSCGNSQKISMKRYTDNDRVSRMKFATKLSEKLESSSKVLDGLTTSDFEAGIYTDIDVTTKEKYEKNNKTLKSKTKINTNAIFKRDVDNNTAQLTGKLELEAGSKNSSVNMKFNDGLIFQNEQRDLCILNESSQTYFLIPDFSFDDIFKEPSYAQRNANSSLEPQALVDGIDIKCYIKDDVYTLHMVVDFSQESADEEVSAEFEIVLQLQLSSDKVSFAVDMSGSISGSSDDYSAKANIDAYLSARIELTNVDIAPVNLDDYTLNKNQDLLSGMF